MAMRLSTKIFRRAALVGPVTGVASHGKAGARVVRSGANARCTLPTTHVLYFGIQAKKAKIDASGVSTANIAEIYNQVSMMLGHEIFDPEIGKRVLVDHAYIVAGGEITKQARNWLGNKLDANKRNQIIFMDRDDILNLFVVTNMPLPAKALPPPPRGDLDDDIPF